MPWQLFVAVGLNMLMQTFQSAAYAARLAGVKTRQIAIAISLFSLVVTASRTANMFYAPMIGTLSDVASHEIQAHHPNAANVFEWQMRCVLAASSAGSILGAALIPLFVVIYMRGIAAFNRTDSLFLACLRLFDFRVIYSLINGLRWPSLSLVRTFSVVKIPTQLLIANTVLTAVYAVGVVAATYASVVSPSQARTSLLLSSIVNGFGTIAMAFIVDPTSAQIVDRAVRGERSLHDVQSMIFWLAVTSIVGTLLAQLLLIPAAIVIANVARIIH